jgi:hypothetical protein
VYRWFVVTPTLQLRKIPMWSVRLCRSRFRTCRKPANKEKLSLNDLCGTVTKSSVSDIGSAIRLEVTYFIFSPFFHFNLFFISLPTKSSVGEPKPKPGAEEQKLRIAAPFYLSKTLKKFFRKKIMVVEDFAN